MTRLEYVKAALSYEARGYFAKAARLWRAAIGLATPEPSPRHIAPGTTLHHGALTCEYKLPGVFVYKDVVYGSISAAARAASKDLGLKSTRVNGWVFWGVDRRRHGEG